MPNATDRNYYTTPEHIDEIGTLILKKYFPRGGTEITNLNVVKRNLFTRTSVSNVHEQVELIHVNFYSKRHALRRKSFVDLAQIPSIVFQNVYAPTEKKKKL